MVDIVLLVLLVLFFGLQQRSRPQLYFRFWFAGWLLVLVSFLNWPLHPAWQHLAAAQGLIGLDAMYLGGLAFLLSLLAEDAHAQTVRAALAVSVPACILLNISSKPSVSFWPLFLLIVALQAAFFYLIFALVPASWKLRRVTLGVLALAGGCMMCIVAGSESPVHLQEWMNAQIFISAGIVFSGTGERRSLDRLVGTARFHCLGTQLLYLPPLRCTIRPFCRPSCNSGTSPSTRSASP